MARIRGRNTKPELIVRKLLHGAGYRFRLHVSGLPGRPDVAFSSRRKAIFVHGCFWHQHRDCRLARVPRSRVDYWNAKFARNRARDQVTLDRLAALGWDVLVVWECETACEASLMPRLRRFLGPTRSSCR